MRHIEAPWSLLKKSVGWSNAKEQICNQCTSRLSRHLWFTYESGGIGVALQWTRLPYMQTNSYTYTWFRPTWLSPCDDYGRGRTNQSLIGHIGHRTPDHRSTNVPKFSVMCHWLGIGRMQPASARFWTNSATLWTGVKGINYLLMTAVQDQRKITGFYSLSFASILNVRAGGKSTGDR